MSIQIVSKNALIAFIMSASSLSKELVYHLFMPPLFRAKIASKGGSKMKLNDLSNSLLKYMVKQYSENHKRDFSNIEELARLFPDEDIQFIYDALASLKMTVL